MRTSDFDYDLPTEFIAQHPVKPRDHSRLMRLDRQTGDVEHHRFFDLPKLLHAGDLLVLNQTRVLPARLLARKQPGGGRVELLLLKRMGERTWQVMVGGRGLSKGRKLRLDKDIEATIVAELGGPKRLVKFGIPIEDSLDEIGHMPLPPYITRPLSNSEEYQTTFSKQPGSAAAPTAGLHFTERIFNDLSERGISTAFVTLHIGLDTFAPVREDDPSEHPIHSEWCSLTGQVAEQLNKARARGDRVIAVGTTAVRTLETAALQSDPDRIQPFEGPTDLFILPGYSFKVVDAMITNFHLPRSTLLMLVSAFADRNTMLRAYDLAKDEGYRFYSFGDAMLIE